MKYTQEQRELMAKEAEGKTIKSLTWCEDGYWVMTFNDSSEISFRFMSEIT